MSKECAIVQDLIPLVNDGISSEESKEFVLKHCQDCKECQMMLDIPVYNEEALNKKWYYKFRFSLVIFVVFLALLSCSFSGTKYQTHNFLLLPFIGYFGHWLLKKNVYVLYIFIFVGLFLTALVQQENIFSLVVFFGSLYCLFLTIGMIIHKCFVYVFRSK